MVRRDLEEVPQFGVPEQYGLRSYLPGDELHWLKIHLAADQHERVTPALFFRRFGTNSAVLGQRQLYLFSPESEPIGTATAWYDPCFEGENFGRVHYVAVTPQYQGRGLSKVLMTAVLARLRELGHSQAYLATSTLRLPAINLYLQFGFKPLTRDAGEEAIWTRVMNELSQQAPRRTAPSP